MSLPSSTVKIVLSSKHTFSRVFGASCQPTNTAASATKKTSGITKYHLAFLRFFTFLTSSSVFCSCSRAGSKRISSSAAVFSFTLAAVSGAGDSAFSVVSGTGGSVFSVAGAGVSIRLSFCCSFIDFSP